jgi:sensor histidine kinase YesM
MDPETLAAAAEKKPGSGGGVGLYNVCMRLKLFYGREDVLRVESAGPGQGTEVTVRIPYEEALDV